MSCEGCSSATSSAKPSGCKSNGTCGTSGCNKLNVYNWLSDIPISDLGVPYPIIEVFFKKGSRKDFYRNNTNHLFEKGDWLTVEGVNGIDVGQVSLTGELVKLQMKKHAVKDTPELKKILRYASTRDLELYEFSKEREKEVLVRSRAIARQCNLEMKISDVEIQADAKKIVFFYTADARVDFRDLIKIFATDFKAKIEMKQIGARQESAIIGGIGSCGRELCCSTWLTDFKTVNTTAARYQNLSINQTKLSGQCGRLKCCLNFELDTYMDALKGFPTNAETLELEGGRVYLQKKDIFKNLMWYSFGGSNKQYPLTKERVQEILDLNKEGKKPEELEAVEIQVKTKDPEKAIDMGFVNDVGQLSLTSLSKSSKKKKKSNKPRQTASAGASPKTEGKEKAGNKPNKLEAAGTGAPALESRPKPKKKKYKKKPTQDPPETKA